MSQRVCLVLILLLTACAPAAAPTPGAVTPPTLAPTPLRATLTPTAPPLSTATAAATPTEVPSPAPTLLATTPTAAGVQIPDGWQVYENRFLGYQVQASPQMDIRTNKSFSMDTGEPVPAGMTFTEYFNYVRDVLPGGLCVTIASPVSALTIAPPGDWVGRYTGPCPGMGVGSIYRMESASLSALVLGQPVTLMGKRLILKASGEFASEFYRAVLDNGFAVTYIGEPSAGMGEAEYAARRDEMLTVLASLSFTREPDRTLPGWTCAGTFTRLMPGVDAVVRGNNETPNRVRSAPDTRSTVIYQMHAGTPFEVTAGPVCVEGLVFWQIASPAIPGGAGWTAEGDMQEYYIEPSS